MLKGKDLKNALTEGIKAEESALEKRFEKADSILLTPLKKEKPTVNLIPKKKRVKIVTKTFTIPEYEFLEIDRIIERCLGLKISINKSEVVRAGIKSLIKMTDENLEIQMKKIEKAQVGRIKK